MAAKPVLKTVRLFDKDDVRGLVDRMSVGDYDRAIADGYTPWEAAAIADEGIDPDTLTAENCLLS
jgi:hypothetical protein